MARMGLGSDWSCLFANDIDPKKAASYVRNWGDSEFRLADVAELAPAHLPGVADLAWASFPCQDLSLAGYGAGLRGERSGAFWPFWNLMKSLRAENRAPSVIVLENVCGALTSHGGEDFAIIGAAIVETGYRFGALVIDAVHFVPQSRPRLFIIAVTEERPIPECLTSAKPDERWRTRALTEAYSRLPRWMRENWLWWRIPSPPRRDTVFADLIEESPKGVKWRSLEETRKLLDMMSPLNLAKVEVAKMAGRRMVGTIYKRTRPDVNGGEDAKSGNPLRWRRRMPSDALGRVEPTDDHDRRRRPSAFEAALPPREAARLMGLPENYTLPENYNEAYHLAGDGLVVPVIRHIAKNILEPVLAASKAAGMKVA